jgi:hypothetical protein
MGRIAVLAVFLSCAAAGAAGADPANAIAAFSLPGGNFNVPLPDGYCIPTGEYEASAKITAAADADNLTDISFTSCSEMAANQPATTWGMIKTPLSTLKSAAGSRSELIDYFKTQVHPEDMKRWTDEASSEGQAQKVAGADTKIEASLKLLDTDAYGAYSGGTLSAAPAGGKGVVLGCAFGVTIANNRVFTLYLFAPYEGAKDVVNLLAKVKTATRAFVAANGG